jgi:hypothetical protein
MSEGTAVPAEGAARRRSLPGLLAALVAITVATISLSDAVNTALTQPQTTDYLAFATGARVVGSDASCLYCTDAQTTAQIGLLGQAPPDRTDFPNLYVNPPLAAFLLRPLASLSLGDGVRLFVLLSLIALAAAALLFLRRLPRSWAPEWRIAAVMSAVASLPAVTGLRLAQWGPFLLLAVAAALVSLDRRRPVAAGLLLAVLLVKPQLVWLVGPVLVVVGSWRVLAGFLAGAASWAISGLLLAGPGQLRALVDLTTSGSVSRADDKEGLPGIVAALGGGATAADIAAGVLGAAAILAVWRLRSRIDPGVGAVAIGLGLSLALSPHTYPDDFIILAVPLLALADWSRAAGLAAAAALSAAWLFDVHVAAPVAVRHAESLVGAAVAAGAVWAVASSARRRGPVELGVPPHLHALVLDRLASQKPGQEVDHLRAMLHGPDDHGGHLPTF